MVISTREEEKRKIWAMSGFSGGLVTDVPAHALNGNQSPDAENFDPSIGYKLKKRLGSSNFTGNKGSPTGTVINGLWAGVFENGTSQIIAKEGTVIADVTAGNWSTNLTGLSPADADEAYFTMFKNLVIMTTSARVAPLKKSSTGGFSALSGSPPSAIYSCAHRRRVWLANTSADPSRIYCSAIDNPEDWSTADAATDFYLGRGDGNTINGLVSAGELLYASKIATSNYEGSLWAVAGDSVSGARAFAMKRIAAFGAVHQRAMIAIDKFVALASREGIFLINGIEWSMISGPIRADYNALTDAQRAKICLGKFKRQLYVSFPASGSTNTKTWVFDLDSRIWSRYNPTTVGIWVTHPDGSLYGASATSTIRVMKFNTGTDDLGSAIDVYWETPNLDFGSWYADKRWFQSFLHTSSAGNTWTLDHYIDDVDQNDNQTFISASGTIVKRIVAKNSEKQGRFWRFKLSESSSSAAEAYGLQVEADLLPRTR